MFYNNKNNLLVTTHPEKEFKALVKAWICIRVTKDLASFLNCRKEKYTTTRLLPVPRKEKKVAMILIRVV